MSLAYPEEASVTSLDALSLCGNAMEWSIPWWETCHSDDLMKVAATVNYR